MSSSPSVSDNCGKEAIPSFPNIEYSFYGYNILKGYPLSDGVDPGFTQPIFKTDFTSAQHTSDCRYAMPKGLIAAEDTACRTSFTSTAMDTTEKFNKCLSERAHAEFGGWGVQFSASQSYQSKSSTAQNENFKIIHSSAQCRYFSTRLNLYNLPPYSDAMVYWLEKLNKTYSTHSNPEDNSLLKFFDLFGTHLSSKTVYGASLTFESELTSDSYTSLSSKGFSVEAQASYSGYFSVGGGTSFSDSQSSAVSEFQSHAEINTLTVGSYPPNDGDTTSWADGVKTSPVPIQYELIPIQEIFTSKLMAQYMEEDVMKRVKQKLRKSEYQYCSYLARLNQGLQCKNELAVFAYMKIFNSTDIVESSQEPNQQSCFAKCAATRPTNCKVASYQVYPLFMCLLGPAGNRSLVTLIEQATWVTAIFPKDSVGIEGYRYDKSAERSQKYKIRSLTSSDQIRKLCKRFCRHEPGCKGFEVSMSPVLEYNCVLYSALGENLIESDIEKDSETSIVAPSAFDLPIDFSWSFNLFVLPDKLLSGLNPVKDCDGDYCCREICKNDPVCVVSVFDSSYGRLQCFHKTHSTNMSISNSKTHPPYSDKAVTVSVFTEKLYDIDFRLTGFEFPDSIVTSSAYSSALCLKLCAADARCDVASWVGEGSFSCHFHNETTFQTSAQYFNPNAFVLFPTITDKMKATQVAI